MLTNIKYKIFQGLAILFSLLTLIALFIPAFFVDTGEHYSLFALILGTEKAAFQPFMLIGFIVLLIGICAEIVILLFNFLKKLNNKLATILGVSSALLILLGGILLGVGPFYPNGIISVMDSELGFTQGQWGFEAGLFLTIIFALIGVAMNYPTAMIILHEKDLQDKVKKENAQPSVSK